MPAAKQVLVVEDDHPIRQMYLLKLKSSGFTTLGVDNGVDGLKLAQEYQPDLILLDLKLPVMSGEEMMIRLRRTNWGSNIRVIVLTNISKDEAPSSLRLLHVDRYIVKAHHTPGQVVEIVKEVLARN